MLMDSIGKNIKFYRKQRGLTQHQLAEAVDISAQCIRQLENGVHLTSLENFICICKILDVPADFILADIDKKFKIASIAQKWQYLAELDDAEFESLSKSIESVYFYKTK